MKLLFLSFTILCGFLIADLSAEVTVTTDFEGGSAEVVGIAAGGRQIIVKPKVVFGRGWPCWWYFRVDGLSPQQAYTVTIQSATNIYREDDVLASQWAWPDSAAISFDNQQWNRTEPGERTETGMTYTFTATGERAWLAWGPPFLASTAEAALKNAKSKVPEAEIFVLAETRHEREVKGIRFGAISEGKEKPFGIWVQARQHAWESGGSWVGLGFLNWATSDALEAVSLREKAIIHFIPIMDVDNVTEGAGGKNAIPRDHNRDWDKSPVYPEVQAAQHKMRELNADGTFDLYVDLHNPGASEKDVYFFGPDLQQLSDDQRRNYNRLQHLAVTHIPKMKKDYQFPSYVRDQEEFDRMSASWVKNHTAPHVVAVTLETGWNRPEGTQEGYQKIGEQLGRAICGYFQENPRENGSRVD